MALARSVTVIPARRRTRNVDAEDKKKLKVAAYCRVSTDSEEQALVMKFKWNTTLPIFRTILNGNLQGFIRHLLQNKKEAKQAYQLAEKILEQKIKLKIYPEKIKVVHFDEGFRFLGFNFWREYMVLPEDRVRKYQDRIKYLSRRQQGKNLEEVIRRLNKDIRGFSNYFKVGNVKSKFRRLDEWIRMRGRAFIRKRCSTESNWRIPNKVLAQAGLVSMVDLLSNRS